VISNIELGDEVRDLVTGVQGIATAKIDYLVGCRHIGITLTSLNDDGVPFPVQWVDEPQLEVVKRHAVDIPIGYEPEPPEARRPVPARKGTGGPAVIPKHRRAIP
jgi:hypothetical protein